MSLAPRKEPWLSMYLDRNFRRCDFYWKLRTLDQYSALEKQIVRWSQVRKVNLGLANWNSCSEVVICAMMWKLPTFRKLEWVFSLERNIFMIVNPMISNRE
jgi:hypothetical protein